MKKAIIITMLLSLAFTLCACGKKEDTAPAAESAGGNAITEYIEKGYSQNGTSVEDGKLTLLMTSPDSTDFVQIDIPVTEDEINAYNALDFFAPDYAEKEREFFGSLSGEAVVISLNDRIPSDDELSKLVGKTFGELAEMGYEQTSVDSDEEGKLMLIYSDAEVDLAVYPEGDYTELMELADEELNALKVSQVRFYAFR